MRLWAVVPLKTLDASKGRLAALLGPAQRRDLTAALLADVLAALAAAPAVERLLVVSPDPAALALGESLGAIPLLEAPLDGAAVADRPSGDAPSGRARNAALDQAAGDEPSERARNAPLEQVGGDAPAERALNAALDQAAAVARAGGAAALLAVPADLPLLTPADVAALTAALPPAPSVVLAATLDGGTSALLRQPPDALPACFGPASLRAHLHAAAARAVTARVLWRPGLALDVDAPEDLQRLAAAPTLGPRTRAWWSAWRARPDAAAAAGSLESGAAGA
jgi:2-phospho-L-lactate/phosphoenolpyruvate guanylyltransferase